MLEGDGIFRIWFASSGDWRSTIGSTFVIFITKCMSRDGLKPSRGIQARRAALNRTADGRWVRVRLRIVVIGGGVTGMFAAHYLLKDGHQVTVVDENPQSVPTSVYNAGLLMPSAGALPTIGLSTILSA